MLVRDVTNWKYDMSQLRQEATPQGFDKCNYELDLPEDDLQYKIDHDKFKTKDMEQYKD